MFPVRGCYQGYDITPDSDTLSFGAVGKGCSLTRTVILSNRGDIGSAFAWNLTQLRDVPFSIPPTNGYVASGMEATIEFIFQPHTIRQEIAHARDTTNISTAVRPKELSKPITSKNTTNRLWTLTPVISGE